jgi:hypothetical protein
MGRHIGYVIPQEEKDKIAATQRRTWALKRRPWTDASRMILAAISDGDQALAHEILDAYMNTEQEG